MLPSSSKENASDKRQEAKPESGRSYHRPDTCEGLQYSVDNLYYYDQLYHVTPMQPAV